MVAVVNRSDDDEFGTLIVIIRPRTAAQVTCNESVKQVVRIGPMAPTCQMLLALDSRLHSWNKSIVSGEEHPAAIVVWWR